MKSLPFVPAMTGESGVAMIEVVYVAVHCAGGAMIDTVAAGDVEPANVSVPP